MSHIEDELVDKTGDSSGAHPSREQTQTLTTDWHKRTFIREAALKAWARQDDDEPFAERAWAQAKALWDAKPEDC